jgi:thiol-disulfide isomerase/thioredoxin
VNRLLTSRRALLAALAVVAVLAGIAAALHFREPPGLGGDALLAVSLPDAAGTSQSLGQWRGKLLVVNFWATWCAPCKKEIPAFNRVYSKYKDQGVVMLGVLHDQSVDSNGVLNFMSDNEFTYPVVVADQEVLQAYHYPNALPTTFIYDRNGWIVTEHKGPMTEQQLASALEKTLGRAR